MRKILLPPVMMVLCILGTWLAKKYGPSLFSYDIFWNDGSWDALGYALFFAGVYLPAWGARIFKKHETNIIPYKSPDSMVTEGPFRFTRNPMYLGMLMMVTGGAVVMGTTVGFVFPLFFFAVANWWYIPFEEMKMARVFGENFDDYKRNVRRWI